MLCCSSKEKIFLFLIVAIEVIDQWLDGFDNNEVECLKFYDYKMFEQFCLTQFNAFVAGIVYF